MTRKPKNPPLPLPPPGQDDLSGVQGIAVYKARRPPPGPPPPLPLRAPKPIDEDDDGLITDEEWDLFVPEVPASPLKRTDRPVITTAERRQFQAMLAEMARRAKESLRLYIPFQAQEEFHACRSGIRLLRGGNRGGKTLGAAVEHARAVTGTDPHNKYPKRGRAIFVGKDLKHCGEVMYRKMFKGGSDENCPFRIIRDATTGDWRVWHPTRDASRRHESQPAPPLVPSRLVTSIGWEDKKEEIPKKIVVEDPCRGVRWEINFFSGEGEPPQGWDVDLIWLDEEIPHPKWFSEMLPRIVERDGRIVWSATPQVGTHHLYELSNKASQQAGDTDARVSEFFVNIFANEYITKDAAERFAADFADDEDEYRVRVLGDFAIVGKRIYPEFQKSGVHRAISFPVPDDWCRYIACDPGRQTAAAAIIAVPPPDNEEYAHVEGIVCNEVYVKKANSHTFAKAVKDTLGEHWVSGWIIDGHGSRVHDTGTGRNIEEQYVEAFFDSGLAVNGFQGFVWGNDDLDAGIMAVKRKLHVINGAPSWLFQTDNLRWMLWEFERYANRSLTKTNIVTDQPIKLYNHLMDCLRYLAQHPLQYQRPPKRQLQTTSWTSKYLKKKKSRAASATPSSGGVACF